jgi:hypothetical protein
LGAGWAVAFCYNHTSLPLCCHVVMTDIFC